MAGRPRRGSRPATISTYHAQKDPAAIIAPAHADLSPYVSRYCCGESAQVLAHELGITDEAFRLRLKAYCLSGKADKSYADIVTEALVMRIAEADEGLKKAGSMLALGIAREECRYSRLDYERRRPHLYGQRVEMSFVGPASISLGLNTIIDIPQLSQGQAPLQIEQGGEGLSEGAGEARGPSGQISPPKTD